MMTETSWVYEFFDSTIEVEAAATDADAAVVALLGEED